MSIVRYIPNNRQPASQNFFDTMFDDFFTPFARVRQGDNHRKLGPQVDIYEKENRIHINAELPGVNKEDISVDIKGKLLTISGERKRDESIEEKDLYRRECHYGSFERSFTLPFEVKSDNIEAAFNNGVLKLAIARPEEEKSSAVTIN